MEKLQQALYNQYTIPEVLESYIKELSKSDDVADLYHANKLRSCKIQIMDRKFLKELRDIFNEIYDIIDSKHPNLCFNIEGRRKSLLSLEKKILHYTAIGKSLDLINDLFAFRITVFGNMCEKDLISHCYKIANDLIISIAKKGFNPCEAPPLIDVKENQHSEYEFYKTFEFKHFIKDYIYFKKENGYQSIHIVFVDLNGKKFEIQIRTLKMHIFAEEGQANHDHYKNKTYGDVEIPLDREKIAVYGYHNEKIDFAGVERYISIFQRQKAF